MKRLSLLLILAAAALPARAQGPVAYDLPTVVRTALRNHPSLRGASAQVAAARAQLRQARAGYAPRLGASAGYTELQNSPSFTVERLGTIVFGKTDNPQASLTVQLPLFTSGRLEGANRQARAGVEAAHGVLARRRQQVARDATVAYFRVLQARSLVSVAEDQLTALQSQRDAIAKMQSRGVATRIDLLRAETAVAGAQEGLTRARNGAAVAAAALATAMGLPADPSLNVTGSDIRQAPSGPPLPAGIQTAADEALRQRPELRELDASRRAAQAGVTVARSGYFPTINAFAQYDATRPTFMPDMGRWSAGVSLTMSLFDAGATHAAVEQARAQVAQVEASRDELRNGITLEATQAFLDVQSARDRVTTTEQGRATAEEGARLVRLGYQNGVNTITDFLTAQAELTRAQTDNVIALTDLRVAEADLTYALGRQP